MGLHACHLARGAGMDGCGGDWGVAGETYGPPQEEHCHGLCEDREH